MLEEIEIRNLGVIADATLPLSSGFTAITGETGAGKTMVITALGLLMGLRSDSGTVRTGSDRATVTGTLKSVGDSVHELVSDAGGEIEDGELTLVRSVDTEGRSRASAGGTRVPAGLMQKIAPELFAVHGQSEQLRLKAASAQRDTLDRFGGLKLLQTKKDYADSYKNLAGLKKELQDLTDHETQMRREAARLEQEIAEIEKADPSPGELDEVRQRVQRLGNIEDLRSSAEAAKAALSGTDDDYGPNAAGLVAQALNEIEKIKTDDETLDSLFEQATSVALQLDEIVRDLGTYLGDLDMDGPAELALASERLDTLTSLTRKYGPEIEDVISYLEKAREKFTSYDTAEVRREELQNKIAEEKNRVQQLGEELTKLRAKAATELSQKVTKELKALALPDAKFQIDLNDSEPTKHGFESVEMLLMPHPGAPARALAKGASGGELSRVMLALEVALAGKDPVPTFVFDEVDSGVGGAAALEIGRRLAKLAESAQVIVVTHLAQVAAFADQHIAIQKDSSGGFTKSSTKVLQGEERVHEMARLMSGVTDSASALEHARELLLQNFESE